jgi:hypothetical protein
MLSPFRYSSLVCDRLKSAYILPSILPLSFPCLCLGWSVCPSWCEQRDALPTLGVLTKRSDLMCLRKEVMSVIISALKKSQPTAEEVGQKDWSPGVRLARDTIFMIARPSLSTTDWSSRVLRIHLHAICTKLTKTTRAGIVRARAPLSAIYIFFCFHPSAPACPILDQT